ncbi:MAG: tetratricopeptide repeat protein [Desulfobulbaceae bacterium]|nr:tetratricopeptide repeat protein [Desulfobulbaceae bacterium]
MSRRRRGLGTGAQNFSDERALEQNCTVASKGWFSSPWPALLFIVTAGLIAFSNNTSGEFIYDDFDTIVDNPEIKTFSPLWSPLWITHMTPISGRPVIALTFAVNYAVNGMDVFGYHLVNNIIHLLAGLTLFGIIRATLLLPRFAVKYGDRANGFALAIALLWLIHPLQTEAVDYITQRTETLAGLFYLLTLFLSVKAFTSDSPQRWKFAAVVICGLGMASKEIMVSAPLIVLCYDRLLVTGSFKEALQRRQKFYFALIATWLILGLLQLNAPRGSAVRFDGFGGLDVTPFDYFRTQLEVVVHYLRLAFWPHPLALSYQDLPMLRTFSPQLIMPTMILVSMVSLTLWGFLRGYWWSLLGLWFFAIISPSSSIIPMPYEIATERRMYLPLAAIIVLAVFIVEHFWARFFGALATGQKAMRFGAIGLLVFILPAMGYATWSRNNDYRTAVRIWTDTVKVRPGNFHAWESLGKALVDAGRIEEAIEPFQEAARLKPNNAEIFSNLGSALGQIGRFDEAVAMHRKALELEPDSAIDHYHLGNTFLRANDLDNAVLAFSKSLSLDPNSYSAHGNLGMIFMQKGDFSGAEKHFEKLRSLIPSNVLAYRLLAELRIAQNRREEAVELYREALMIAPEDSEILARLNALTVNRPQ